MNFGKGQTAGTGPTPGLSSWQSGALAAALRLVEGGTTCLWGLEGDLGKSALNTNVGFSLTHQGKQAPG